MAKILVIDDEPEFLAVLRETLVKLGHDVTAARGSLAGLTAYRAERPDLVITDIFMPDLGGLNVLMQLARDSSVRVIAMSGGGPKGLVEVLDDAPAFGAWGTLHKPFTRSQLIAVIDEALGVKAQHGVA